jgi:tetratricopeptide (TPR) repeat protein
LQYHLDIHFNGFRAVIRMALETVTDYAGDILGLEANMNRYWRTLAALLSIALGMQSAGAEDKPDFVEQMKRELETYKDFFDEESKKLLNDHLLEANADLARRADAEKSAMFDLITANNLYSMDPQESLRLHKRAFEAFPAEPLVNLEWAMESHRSGDFAAAIPAYELFLNSRPSEHKYWALLADCYVRAGKYDDAIGAWQKAKHGSNHTEIDFAICEIYGGPSPLRKRADLLKIFESGDHSVAEALVLQDLQMEEDWWNGRVYDDGLARDLDRVSRALGADSQRYRELAALAALMQDKKLEAKTVTEKLTELHILVEGGALPVNSFVASQFIRLAFQKKLLNAADLLDRFGKDLELRATTGTGDAEAFNVLGVLYSEVQNWKRVHELDAAGWEKFHDVRFVTSFLAGMARDDALKIDTPEFIKALKEFPENNWLQSIRLHLVGAKVTADDVAAAIKSEYRQLSAPMGMRDSYTLKAYFAALQKLRNP